MAITRVQSVTNGGEGAIASTTFPSYTGKHRLVVVGIVTKSSGGVDFFASANNGFIRFSKVVQGSLAVELWYHNDCGPLNYVEFNITGTAKWAMISIEYSGGLIFNDPFETLLDGRTTASGTGTTAGASTSGTSTDTGDVFVTVHGGDRKTLGFTSPTNSFSNVATADTGGGGGPTAHASMAMAERIPGATATFYSQCTLTNSVDWGSIHVAIKPDPGGSSSKFAKYFTWDGDGNNHDEFTGFGFTPEILILHDELGVSSFTTNSMMKLGADPNTRQSSTLGGILSDGFKTYFTTWNGSGRTYHGMAFRRSTSTIDIEYGMYVGDNNDNRNINGLGFAPDLVLIKPYGTNPPAFRSSAQTGDNSFERLDATTETSDFIQALNADGFQVGTGLNGAGVAYFFIAFKEVTGGAEGAVRVGSYTGNGADDRDITVETGFSPEFTMVLDTAGGFAGHWRQETLGDDEFGYYSSGTPNSNNGIQRVHSNGFQVGTVDNASSRVYRYACFGLGLITLTDSTPPATGRLYQLTVTGVGD